MLAYISELHHQGTALFSGHEQNVGEGISLDLAWLNTCLSQNNDSISRDGADHFAIIATLGVGLLHSLTPNRVECG
jgi:hypothetical protein